MAGVRLQGLRAIFALGLICGLGGGAIADAGQGGGRGGAALLRAKASHSASAPHGHRRAIVAQRRSVRARPVAATSAVGEPAAAASAVARLNCAGANAWSMMCPGAQLLGANY